MKRNAEERRLPWASLPSIYEYVQNKINDKGVIPHRYWKLPDDVFVENLDFEYEPGYDDWVELCEQDDPNPAFIIRLVNIVEQYSWTGKEKDKIELYNMLKEDRVIGYWDRLIEEFNKRKIPITRHSLELCRWMVCKAPLRGVVKMGIILIGLMGMPKDIIILKVIAKHEEFTYFVGRALRDITPMWDLILIELIEPLSWWGRMLCAEMLALNSKRPKVRAWLVRYGYRKFYLTPFVSLTCAEYGELDKELLKDNWDKALLEATQITIIDLLREVTSSGASYTFGGKVICLYLKRQLGKQKTIIHFSIIRELLNFFDRVTRNENLLSMIGLSEEDYSDIWIDIHEEIKKSWYIKQVLVLKEEWDEGYTCLRAYNRLCR